MKLEIGDIILVKKPHPCGGNSFEIVRKGADMKMRCLTCEKELWITREKLERKIRKINGALPE
ncbi:DUF951 domain-containing protein [Guggenheimella bovis]